MFIKKIRFNRKKFIHWIARWCLSVGYQTKKSPTSVFQIIMIPSSISSCSVIIENTPINFKKLFTIQQRYLSCESQETFRQVIVFSLFLISSCVQTQADLSSSKNSEQIVLITGQSVFFYACALQVIAAELIILMRQTHYHHKFPEKCNS